MTIVFSVTETLVSRLANRKLSFLIRATLSHCTAAFCTIPPRTSSPGVGDTGNYMTSLLNQTDPGPLPSTRPQPIFPITGRPEPSPFFPPPDQRGHFPPSQPPLQ